ncbi:MAG TPA: zf-HC2 domain-containing protein [Caulobacteraceae bacterium]
MTGKIIRLHQDQHREVQLMLPWFVTGRLSADEQAQVEAHLNTCAECRSDLELEHGLAMEVANLSSGVEQGWASMVRRLEGAPRRRGLALRSWRRTLGLKGARFLRIEAPWLGWLVAAQVGLFLLVTTLSPPAQSPARYHTLAAAPAHAAGNIVVIFHPATTEGAMRQMLKVSSARLVDGPTAAGAYVLQVPDVERAAALARLKARREVLLAEPIDPGQQP